MLTVEGLHLRQGDFHLMADLAVAEGSVTAVMGPSGGGKSSLLGAIAGFLPAEGRITWRGAPISGLAPWERPVSILFQDNNLFPHLTVAQNAALVLAPRRRPTSTEQAAVLEMLARLEIADLAERRPGSLSGGQAARAALARVLLAARPLVLLDEPFAALGPALRAQTLALTRDALREQKATLIFVTHAPDEARAIADHLVLVDGGRAGAPLPLPAALDTPPAELAAYLGR